MRPPPVIQVSAAFTGFAVFGAFWGAWGATVPALREQAGLSDGQLGTALLFVGAGALPAMLITGRVVDRWGHRRVTPLLLLSFAASGLAVVSTASGFLSLCLGLLLLGATSGATDVAINAAAASAERACARPVITRAHGVFSASVVVASLGTGLLRRGDIAVTVPFALVTVAAVAAAIAVFASSATTERSSASSTRFQHASLISDRSTHKLRLLPLLTIGGLAAVAFAVENAHQSWSAVYLGDVLSAGPAVAAAGPAVFAAVAAVTRFAVGALGTAHASSVLIAGATAAAAGTTVLATASSVAVALSGLGVAAAGTAVLYPTLLSLATTRVSEVARGAATSVVATAAYLGFLVGPFYVGVWSGAVGLPGAMLAVAALAAGLSLVTWPALRTVRVAHGSGLATNASR